MHGDVTTGTNYVMSPKLSLSQFLYVVLHYSQKSTKIVLLLHELITSPSLSSVKRVGGWGEGGEGGFVNPRLPSTSVLYL